MIRNVIAHIILRATQYKKSQPEDKIFNIKLLAMTTKLTDNYFIDDYALKLVHIRSVLKIEWINQ